MMGARYNNNNINVKSVFLENGEKAIIRPPYESSPEREFVCVRVQVCSHVILAYKLTKS